MSDEARNALAKIVKFAVMNHDFYPQAAADAILAAGYRKVEATTEFEYGIRWEDGSDVAWDSRSAAEYEIRGVYPNMIGQLIRRNVSRGPWVSVSPEGGE